MDNLSYELALGTNPLGTSQKFNSGQEGAHIGALDHQRQNPFNGAAPLIVPIEKAPPTIVINNGNNPLPIPRNKVSNSTNLVPNLYPKTGPTLITLPTQPSTAVQEEPKNTSAAGILLSQRPVRKSSLKRTFTIHELEDCSSDDQKSNRSGKKKKKIFSPAATRPPPQQCLPQERPQELIPCLLDTLWPRRPRSELERCPKTSRVSISRLKQAAHGKLPLGGSKSLALALLGEDLERDAGKLDDNDMGYSSRRRQNTINRQAQSSSKAAYLDNSYQQHDHQQNTIGPNLEQRKAMCEIAEAPPHLRVASLRQYMQKKLGMPREPISPLVNATSSTRSGMNGPVAKPPSTPVMPPPLLTALPAPEQQQIVKQLLSQMTPQQRHTLLQSSASHQAHFIQQNYVKRVALMQLQPRQPLERQPSHGLNPMVPLSAVAPTATTAGHVLQRENSTTQSHAVPSNTTSTLSAVRGASVLRDLLSELGESAEAMSSVMTMPREQQRKILIDLIQRRKQRILTQQQEQQRQQQQNINAFGEPVELPRHQLTLQNRQGSLDIRNTAMTDVSLDRHHSMPLLGPLAVQSGEFAVPAGGGGGASAGNLYAPDLVDLNGMLSSGDALEDAMSFLV